MKLLTGVAAGLLSHQLDHVFKHLERNNTPPDWLLLSRYGIGYLTAVGVLVYMAEEDNTRRDVGLLSLAAGVSVGLGVVAGRMIDYAIDG
jgi:hypothetical protein